MRSINSNIMIFSVYRSGTSSFDNYYAHRKAVENFQHAGIPFVELEGVFNGVKELSIMVLGFQYRQIVESYSREYNQECYLESHNDRVTFLVYPDGSRIRLGVLRSVSQSEALAARGYTYRPDTNTYYLAD